MIFLRSSGQVDTIKPTDRNVVLVLRFELDLLSKEFLYLIPDIIISLLFPVLGIKFIHCNDDLVDTQ